MGKHRDEAVGTYETREEAIEESIRLCQADAVMDDEAYEVVVCVGDPCTGNPDGCPVCDRIVCFPNGIVKRDLTKH